MTGVSVRQTGELEASSVGQGWVLPTGDVGP